MPLWSRLFHGGTSLDSQTVSLLWVAHCLVVPDTPYRTSSAASLSIGSSACGTLDTNSLRRVLKSSPWARHFLMKTWFLHLRVLQWYCSSQAAGLAVSLFEWCARRSCLLKVQRQLKFCVYFNHCGIGKVTENSRQPSL